MPTLTIHYTTEAERLAYERAIAFVAEIHQLGLDSPAEAVVEACEGLALGRGRDLLRDSLAAAVQARVELAEKNGGAAGALGCGHRGLNKGPPRMVLAHRGRPDPAAPGLPALPSPPLRQLRRRRLAGPGPALHRPRRSAGLPLRPGTLLRPGLTAAPRGRRLGGRRGHNPQALPRRSCRGEPGPGRPARHRQGRRLPPATCPPPRHARWPRRSSRPRTSAAAAPSRRCGSASRRGP